MKLLVYLTNTKMTSKLLHTKACRADVSISHCISQPKEDTQYLL